MTDLYRCLTSALHDAEWEIVARDEVSVTVKLVQLGKAWNAGHTRGELAVVPLAQFERDWRTTNG